MWQFKTKSNKYVCIWSVPMEATPSTNNDEIYCYMQWYVSLLNHLLLLFLHGMISCQNSNMPLNFKSHKRRWPKLSSMRAHSKCIGRILFRPLQSADQLIVKINFHDAQLEINFQQFNLEIITSHMYCLSEANFSLSSVQFYYLLRVGLGIY